MTQPIHLIGEMYCISIPDDAAEIEICNYGLNDAIEFTHKIDGIATYDCDDLPTGNWQLICTTKECIEEQAKRIVGSSEWFFPARHTRYIDYGHPYGSDNKQAWSIGFSGPRDSLRSLLVSKGCDSNKNYVIIKRVSKP